MYLELLISKNIHESFDLLDDKDDVQTVTIGSLSPKGSRLDQDIDTLNIILDASDEAFKTSMPVDIELASMKMLIGSAKIVKLNVTDSELYDIDTYYFHKSTSNRIQQYIDASTTVEYGHVRSFGTNMSYIKREGAVIKTPRCTLDSEWDMLTRVNNPHIFKSILPSLMKDVTKGPELIEFLQTFLEYVATHATTSDIEDSHLRKTYNKIWSHRFIIRDILSTK